MLLLLLLAAFAAVRAVPNVPRYVRSISFMFVLHLFLLAHPDCTHTFLLVSRYASIAKLTRCYCASAKWQSCRARSTTFAPLQLDLDARVAAHTAVEKRWVHAMAQLAQIERLQQVAASKASTSSSCARCERSALRSDASRRSRPLRSDSNQSARRATATLASYAERATAVQGSSSSAAIRRDGTR